jgi:hypothetical protein
VGVITTLSGTSLTYGTAGITTLTTTTGTITNLNSTNLSVSGVTTSSGGFVGNLTGTASSATQLVTPRDFSITGNFVTAPTISFNGTGNVAFSATITQNSIVLGTYTSGNYVDSISGTTNQITISTSPTPGAQPQIGLSYNTTIDNNLYVTNNLGIGTTTPAYNLDITTGNGSRVGISTLGNITATGIVSTSQLYVSGVTTSTRLSIGTAGTTITTNNNRVGIGTTNPQGILDLVSTTSPFYLPRMTTTQRDAMSGISSGAMIYNISVNEFQGRTATTWVTIGV